MKYARKTKAICTASLPGMSACLWPTVVLDRSGGTDSQKRNSWTSRVGTLRWSIATGLAISVLEKRFAHSGTDAWTPLPIRGVDAMLVVRLGPQIQFNGQGGCPRTAARNSSFDLVRATASARPRPRPPPGRSGRPRRGVGVVRLRVLTACCHDVRTVASAALREHGELPHNRSYQDPFRLHRGGRGFALQPPT